MAVKHPQFDNKLNGGSDTWDNGLAGEILLEDYFEQSLATTTYVISANTGANFGGVTDTYLLENDPATNFGTSTRIGIKAWTTADREHSVIKFGGISSLPSGTVLSSKLRFYCTSIGNDPFDLPTLNVFKLRRAFVENQATWNIAATGTNWGTAGALNTANDFDNALLGSVLVNLENAYYEVTGTALTAYVQAIVSGGADDGLLLTESNYLAPLNQFKEAFFVSSNGTNGLRPELVIEVSGASGGTISATGTSSGLATTSANTQSVATSVGASNGLAATTSNSRAVTTTQGASAGVGSVAGQIASIVTTVGNANGLATALGNITDIGSGGIVSAAGTSNGLASTNANARSLATTQGTSAGLATTTANARVIASATGTSSGQAVVSGNSQNIRTTAGASAGVATVSAAARVIASTSGASSGQATSNGVIANVIAATGNATGTAAVNALAGSVSSSTGNSAGLSITLANAVSIVITQGIANGTCTVAGGAQSIVTADVTTGTPAHIDPFNPFKNQISLNKLDQNIALNPSNSGLDLDKTSHTLNLNPAGNRFYLNKVNPLLKD